MKKITIIIFAIIALVINGSSQGKIKNTQTIIELEKGRKGESVIGSTLVENFIYTITQVGKGRRAVTFLSKYDTRMKLIKKVDWDLDYKKGSIDRLIVLNDKLYVLFELIDSKTKTAELYFRSLDKGTLKLSPKELLISKKYTKRRYTPDYSFIEENDRILYINLQKKTEKKICR